MGLKPPRDGFQVRDVGVVIPPGEDVEYCEVARLPGQPADTYVANRFEFGNGLGSHHLIVSAAVPGSPTEAKLEVLGVGERVTCLGAESVFGSEFENVGGSQQPYRELVLPDGVGRTFHGGQWIVFNYHYLNASDAPIPARSAVNFHLTDPASIQHFAQSFGFTNFTIATPAGETGSFTAECRFARDVMLGSLTRHTHRWGTDFSVWYAGGLRDGQAIWTSHDFEHEVDHAFETPVRMRAGEGLRFSCSYQNDTDHTLRFGTSASDEMCILFGILWSSENVAQLANQSCSIVWNDGAGIGHPADEAGGFPAPVQTQVEACLAAGAGDSCSQCRCEGCAAPLIQCSAEADCAAALDCYSRCPAGSECDQVCQSTVDAHSSGVGSLVQVGACLASRCAEACGAG